MVGISAMSLSVPPYRVNLQDWCEWTGAPWDKIRNVVGHSFRICSPLQNVYTLAADAVIRLIQANGIDPQKIRYLALGTESSTDNAAGAVIVKGLVNQALTQLGLKPLSRYCEVPEFKHACLGGIYALKNALRFLTTDARDDQAIVVSADIAEYEQGSSGEATQGAGAVAMLVDHRASLAQVDLQASGSASEYRGADFRKPFVRYLAQDPAQARLTDYPVFNGKYSTHCYLDAVLHALDDFYQRRDVSPADYLNRVAAVFMHRPYHYMPRSSWGLSVLAALARGDSEQRQMLGRWSRDNEIDSQLLLAELQQRHPLHDLNGTETPVPYPLAHQLLKAIRKQPDFEPWVDGKMQLGSQDMMHLGNLYTAALPAWLGCGLEQAAGETALEPGDELLAIGYGSGDAAEVLSLELSEGWDKAAAQLKFHQALLGSTDLTEAQYRAMHQARLPDDLPPLSQGCVISHVGESVDPAHYDKGIEYYRYIT